jgi:hypothetical protein
MAGTTLRGRVLVIAKFQNQDFSIEGKETELERWGEAAASPSLGPALLVSIKLCHPESETARKQLPQLNPEIGSHSGDRSIWIEHLSPWYMPCRGLGTQTQI